MGKREKERESNGAAEIVARLDARRRVSIRVIEHGWSN